MRCASYGFSKVKINLIQFLIHTNLKFNNFYTKGLNFMKQNPCTPPCGELFDGMKMSREDSQFLDLNVSNKLN